MKKPSSGIWKKNKTTRENQKEVIKFQIKLLDNVDKNLPFLNRNDDAEKNVIHFNISYRSPDGSFFLILNAIWMHLWAVHTYLLKVSTDQVAITQKTKIENSWGWDSASKMDVHTAWVMTQSLALTYLKPGNHSNLWHWLQSVKWLLYIIAAPLCSVFCAVLGWCEWIYKRLDINPQKGGSFTTLILWSKLLLFFLCLGPFIGPIWTLHCSLGPEWTPTLTSWKS